MKPLGELKEKVSKTESKAETGMVLTDNEMEKVAGGAPGTCNLYKCDFAEGCGRLFTADYKPKECPYCGCTNISMW